MTRTQIQLPDELHQRAKAFAVERELSLAEIVRRGLELFLSHFPATTARERKWEMPRIDGGGIQVPLHRLHEISAGDEDARSPSRV